MIREKAGCSKIVLALASGFILTESVLYVLLHAPGVGHFSELAYLSVLIAVAFSFVSVGRGGREEHLIRAGMLFTLLADWFLVVSDPQRKLLGVCAFLVTQGAYFLYIYLGENRKVRRIHLFSFATVSIISVAATLAVLGDGADPLAVISVLYYSWLVLNLAFSLLGKELRLFSIALVLFSLCDLSIGLTEMANSYFDTEMGSILYKIANSSVNLAWIFYLPSQVLIALFLLPERKNTEGDNQRRQ